MGLDMYLDKVNKKLNQEEAEEFIKYEELKYEITNYQDYIKEYEKSENITEFVKNRWKQKLEAYEKIKNDPIAVTLFSNSVFYIVTPDTPKLTDFKTKEELIKFYKKNEKRVYLNIKSKLEKIEKEYEKLSKKYKDAKIEEIAYWRKHADLNEYLTQLAEQRNVIDKEGYFNGQYLVLSKEDIEKLLELIKLYLKGEYEFKKGVGFFWGETRKDDWIYTKEVLEKVLKETNFEKESILYCCSW